MSEIIKTFSECLHSELTCKEILEKMKSVCKYEINQGFDEKSIIELFISICFINFNDVIKNIYPNFGTANPHFSSQDIFKISHLIIKNKIKYMKNPYYKTIEFLYQTFFFYEFNDENQSNDFTFFLFINENTQQIDPDLYTSYLFNIGHAILTKEKDEKFINMLFSETSPAFIKNIAMICFQYIRNTNKDYSNFVKLCIPSLNFYNNYFLCQKIKQELKFSFKQKLDKCDFMELENFILNSKNNSIIDEQLKEKNENAIILTNDNDALNELNEGDLSMYFSFPNGDDEEKMVNFFQPNNLLKNKDDFSALKNSKFKDSQYKISYDTFEIKDKVINAFSFPILLKYQLINKIDEHFFQIYNDRNIKIELFSYLLLNYIDSINNFLNGSIKKEEKIKLFENSGFYKINNDYVLLVNVKEDDEKYFYLKINLCKNQVTSINNNKKFRAYQITENMSSSANYTNDIGAYYIKDEKENALYNFGNYCFEHDIREFFRNYVSNNKDVLELPRLYFLMNYSIPISGDQYHFITNVKKLMLDNCSYGYSELDFVLKNQSNQDIVVSNEVLPYKEKLFMIFPSENFANNNGQIILKSNSVIFFEFKVSFPNYDWKDKFKHFFKKIQIFLDLYRKRELYVQENIQIFFVYDNMPDIFYISYMKMEIDKLFKNYFESFEFGVYYFSRGINMINNQEIKSKLKEHENLLKDILNIINISKTEEINKKVAELKDRYKFK
jgi:hypothetical protein